MKHGRFGTNVVGKHGYPPCTEIADFRIKTAIIGELGYPQAAFQFGSQMSTKIKTAILVVSAGVLLFAMGGGISGVRASNDGAYRQMEVYSEVLSRVRSEYVEEPNLPTVTDGALHGLLESLDSNSSYLNPEQYKDYKSHRRTFIVFSWANPVRPSTCQ